jgi:N-methylhydantoinase B
VSPQAARDDYGVILVKSDGADDYAVDTAATARRRAELRARRTASLPMVDRGDGYEKMLRGECAPRMR